MKTIFLTLALLLFGTLYGQEICLTDKEYNDLLVASNCTELYKADSILLWDKQREINLQSEYIKGQKDVIAITDSQLKKSKRQVIKYKFGMFTAIILGIVSNIYLILK
jgi:hypothetical protein